MAVDRSAAALKKRKYSTESAEPSQRTCCVNSYGTYSNRSSRLKRHRQAQRPSTTSSSEPAAKRLCFPDASASHTNHSVDHWRRSGFWPGEYFQPDAMGDYLAYPTLRRKRSEAGSLASTATRSVSYTREEKAAPYRDSKYDALLDSKGVITGTPTGQITSESKRWCGALLKTEASVPDVSVFQDSSFDRLYDNLQGANEARIVQDIARLIVPSAERSFILGDDDLAHLTESVDEGWNNAIPLVGSRPQPDYSVGFNRKAFSDDQNDKLRPYIGTWPSGWSSYFMGTWYMHFPFLASEVKCGSGGLEVADRQNAHSMALAVRAVVSLYRRVNRVEEVDREILAFSVSHDSKYVRIYGHFPVIDGEKVDYCRYSIASYDLTASEGEKRWTAYKFVTNVYKLWAPRHLQRLQSAIHDLTHEKNGRSVQETRETVPSQGSSTQAGSSIAAVELIGDDSNVREKSLTPGTSFSEQAPSKRPKA